MKKGLEFGFGWIFSIIVGAVILFLAVYAASKVVGNSRYESNTVLAKQLSNIIDGLSTGLDNSKITPISISQESLILFSCQLGKGKEIYGKQKVSMAVKSNIGNWKETGINITSIDQYVFSENSLEGRNLYAFSKPFEMPFKVADLTFIWTNKQRYCFVDAPNFVEDELKIRSENGTIVFVDSKEQCAINSTKVCFSESCDVEVVLDAKAVRKKGKTVYYEDALIYGAIFSSTENYECQVKRLMARTSELANLYIAKSQYLASRTNGCGSNMQPYLLDYKNISISSSLALKDIYAKAEGIEEANDAISSCKIF